MWTAAIKGKGVATPARKLTNYRAIPYRLVLSSASKTSGTAHDATFVFKHQPWGLDPLMDLARTKFKLRVESFTVTGVKNAPGDTDVALAVLVNVDGQGFEHTFTYDAVNRGMTACVCTATGNHNNGSPWRITGTSLSARCPGQCCGST